MVNDSTLPVSNKQPPGVYTMFFLQMLGMVGFGMLIALLVQYAEHTLGFDDNPSTTLYGAYVALVGAASIPGGYLAERFLGYFFGAILSIILISVGLLIIMIPNTEALYIGLGPFIIGTGMMVPCMFVILGHLFKHNDPRREHGFVLAYVGMNLGAFLSGAVSGAVRIHWGYSYAFLIGAIASILMIPIILSAKKTFTANLPGTDSRSLHLLSAQRKWIGFFYTLILIAAAILLVDFAKVANGLLIILCGASFILIISLALGEEKRVRDKLFVFTLLTLFSITFWTLYSLSPSVLRLFTERNVYKHILNIPIQAENFSSINPFFIIAIGPFMGTIWAYFARKNINISIPMKFAIGILLMGIGFLVLVVGIYFHDSAGYTGTSWLILSYFFQTVGELLVGPIGYAMVALLVPARKEGVMMGIWQIAAGIGGSLTQYLGKYVDTTSEITNPLITNPQYSHAFAVFGYVTVLIGLIAMATAPILQRIINAPKNS